MSYNDISQQWQIENEDLNSMSEEISQIDFQLVRFERCLATQFKLLCFMTQTQHHVNKLYKNPEQFPFNRNAAFMTFEPTRVTVGLQQDKEKIQNYINANFIEIEGKRVIATQGPLTNSFYNFWKMVDQYEVKNIFMLCNLIEKNKIKCDRYYPKNDPENNKIVEQEYQIIFQEEEKSPNEEYVRIKKLQLKNNKTHQTKIITHYQFVNWPDGDIPNCKAKKIINLLVDQFTTCLAENSIPVVHCSAGVGRTGTFIAMGLIRILIKNNQNISIFNEVRKLREQRWGMVHNLSQYQYLYDFAEKQIVHLHSGIGSLSEDSSDQIQADNP